MWVLYFYNTKSCQELLRQIHEVKGLNCKMIKIEKKQPPNMIRGVPSLINTNKKLIFEGEKAFEIVQKLQAMQNKQKQNLEQKSSSFKKINLASNSKTSKIKNMKPTVHEDVPLTQEYINDLIKKRNEMLNIPQKI